MIVGVVADFEMTFATDLIKVALQNNDFAIKPSIPKNKIGYGPFKTSGEQCRASWLSCSLKFGHNIHQQINC